MRPIKILILCASALAAGCVSWQNRVTPSGHRCSDMPVVGYGKEELLQGRQVHRLRAVAATKCDSTTECLEELRKAGCDQEADAIVDVFTEARGLSGIAARFTGAR